MNKTETIKIMATLKAAYPQYYRDMPDADVKAAVNLWQSMFDDTPYETVAAGVKAFMAADAKGFPPSIGQVKERITLLTRPQDRLTEQEAWALVKKALRNSAYGYREEFEKLPSDVRAIVGSASVLREWGQINMDEVDTVVASNFMRSYRARVQYEREYDALPQSVKLFAAGVSARMPEKEQVYIDNYDHAALEEKIRRKLAGEQQG